MGDIEKRNKPLVIEAFDTLFNNSTNATTPPPERFWSPHYIQHSAHIEPGREGLFDLVKAAPLHRATNTNSSSPTVTT